MDVRQIDLRQLIDVALALFRFSDAVAGWLLTYLLHSTLWILAALWLTTRRSMRAAPALQHAAWTGAMVAGFASAAVQLTGMVDPVLGRLLVATGVARPAAAVVVRISQDSSTRWSVQRAVTRFEHEAGAPGRPPYQDLGIALDGGRLQIEEIERRLRTAPHDAERRVIVHRLRVDSSAVAATLRPMALDAGFPPDAEFDHAFRYLASPTQSLTWGASLPLALGHIALPAGAAPVVASQDSTSIVDSAVVRAPHSDARVASSIRPRVIDGAPTPSDGAAIRTLVGRAPAHRLTFPVRSGVLQRTAVLAPPPSLVAVVVWSVLALLLLARLTIRRHRLARLLSGRAHVAHGTVAVAALDRLRASSGFARQVTLSATPRLMSPAALSGKEIALPLRALAELTASEQESLLAHELAHVARRDTLWLRLAHLIECVAWVQPLNRVARRRMQLTAEFAADAWAAKVTGAPLRLASSLARVAEWVMADGGRRSAALVGADGSPLVERVRRLTAPPETFTSRPGSSLPLAIMLASACVIVAVAPEVAVGRAASAPTARVDQPRDVLLIQQRATTLIEVITRAKAR